MKPMIILPVAAVALTLGAALKFSRAGYESPRYEVEAKDGAFEIRRYPSLEVATTRMDGPTPNDSDSFMRLFRYISGANESQTKIAMTTPVLMKLDKDQETMSFIAPVGVAESGSPRASDSDIDIETIDSGRFATFRYSGSWSREKTEGAQQLLLDWIQQQELEIVGSPIMAGYDPPFTPPFLRRNEILVRVADGIDSTI